MGACYSQCEEDSITPTHLGTAANTYYQQQQQQQQQQTSDPPITRFRDQQDSTEDLQNPMQYQRLREILNQQARRDSEAIRRGELIQELPDMGIKRGKRGSSPGFPPNRVKRLSTTPLEGADTDDEVDTRRSEQSCASEYPSISNSAVAIYAKKRISVDGLPLPGSTDSTFACILRLKRIMRLTERDEISKDALLENLTYALKVVEKTYIEETKRLRDEDDDLSETATSEVPDEVRDWLATTFTRNQSSTGRRVAKPRFRSVVNAIRAGIVVERIYRRMSSCTCLTLPPNVVLLLKGGLDEWNFDIFEFNEVSSNHALKFVGFELLHKYNLISKFQIDNTRLENLLLRLEIGYSKYKNPYHNLIHASDVAQTCHVILTTSRLRDYLTDLDIFAVIFAAIIHDFEHTGTTNSFHIQTQTELAMLYNDRNVLENYHVSAVFRIVQEAEFNIFENLSKEQFQEFRTAVIDMVLNTDMSLHFSQMKNMKNLIAIPEIIDKLKALSLLVHCADIAHPCKEWSLHKHWSCVLSEEFFRQGDREKELGMPISPLCDRNTVVLPQSQIGFIDFIVEPIFVVLGDMLDKMMENALIGKEEDTSKSTESGKDKEPGSAGSSESLPIPVKRPWVVHLKENKEHWGTELKDLEKAKESEEKSCKVEEPEEPQVGHAPKAEAEGDESANREAKGARGDGAGAEVVDKVSDNLDGIDYIDQDAEVESEGA